MNTHVRRVNVRHYALLTLLLLALCVPTLRPASARAQQDGPYPNLRIASASMSASLDALEMTIVNQQLEGSSDPIGDTSSQGTFLTHLYVFEPGATPVTPTITNDGATESSRIIATTNNETLRTDSRSYAIPPSAWRYCPLLGGASCEPMTQQIWQQTFHSPGTWTVIAMVDAKNYVWEDAGYLGPHEQDNFFRLEVTVTPPPPGPKPNLRALSASMSPNRDSVAISLVNKAPIGSDEPVGDADAASDGTFFVDLYAFAPGTPVRTFDYTFERGLSDADLLASEAFVELNKSHLPADGAYDIPSSAWRRACSANGQTPDIDCPPMTPSDWGMIFAEPGDWTIVLVVDSLNNVHEADTIDAAWEQDNFYQFTVHVDPPVAYRVHLPLVEREAQQ